MSDRLPIGAPRGSRSRATGVTGLGPDDELVWHQIRRGVRPDSAAIAEVAGVGIATLGLGGVAALDAGMRSRLLGAGPLDLLLEDPEVTDVAVNGDGSVWVDRGAGMERVAADVGGPDALRHLGVRLAGLAGRRLDETSPYVDGQLPSGIRLHAILPPLVSDGPHITLRVPSRTVLSVPDLARRGMFPPAWEPMLRRLVTRRVAFVVTGGTGAGKTTLLGGLLAQTSSAERIVLVEDVRELRVDHPHVVRLEARPANVEGAGEVPLVTLVRQALRMRPDRLVVGEVRGAEVRELLSALNTGHEGGCGTLHANTAADVVPRFEALGALAEMAPGAVHAQLATAVRVVLHVRRLRSSSGPTRILEAVAVLRRDGPGRDQWDERVGLGAGWGGPHCVTALSFDGVESRRGPAWTELAQLLGLDEDASVDEGDHRAAP